MLYYASGDVCPKCRSDLVYDTSHKRQKEFCINCAHNKLKSEYQKLKRKYAKCVGKREKEHEEKR